MAHPDKMPTHCAFILPAGLGRLSEDDHTVITLSRLQRLFADYEARVKRSNVCK